MKWFILFFVGWLNYLPVFKSKNKLVIGGYISERRLIVIELDLGVANLKW
jgi:hypothetical protein